MPTFRRPTSGLRLLAIVALVWAISAAAFARTNAATGAVVVLEIRSAIDPVTATFIRQQIDNAPDRGDAALVIVLEMSDASLSSTDSVVRAILASPVPVIVYVPDHAAPVTSAGLYIAMAATLFAIAPDAAIGSDTPARKPHNLPNNGTEAENANGVSIRTMSEAVANISMLASRNGRNTEAAAAELEYGTMITGSQAVANGIADLTATGTAELLRSIDGKTVTPDGTTSVLHTANATVKTITPALPFRLLSSLSNPNVAYVLFMLGVLGILFELSIPGFGAPGIAGTILLVLALFGFGALPVHISGVALALLGVVLFVVEIKVPTHGVLTLLGISSIVVGSFLLFPPWAGPALPGLAPVRIAPALIIGMSGGLLCVLGFVAVNGARVRRLSPKVGRESIIGAEGVAITDLSPQGVIRAGNEEWTAFSTGGEIHAGEEVFVVAAEGVHLMVVRKF